MSHPILDPLASVVHERIAELRREAAADRRARLARSVRPRTGWSWPPTVVAALRDTLGRSGAPTAVGSRRGTPCPTC